MQGVTEDLMRDQINRLGDGDRALSRTNPFAIDFLADQLVTADQVAAGYELLGGSRFVCPKCVGAMRHYVRANGTPFFAHAAARGNCPSGFETPSHLCIKRGLRSIGFSCEHLDDATGFKFDAYHADTDTVVEVISSGTDRYSTKISALRSSGRKCWYILDSGSRSLGSRDGSESICLNSFRNNGTVVVGGLFRQKAASLFSLISQHDLFAFYLGLIWKSVGDDRWQLLDVQHPLSQAATADDGMKHLMVKMHLANAFVVTENSRNKINRRTWFDKTFRYRGEFTTHWSGDRDHIVGIVSKLIRDAEYVSERLQCGSRLLRAGSPSTPVHSSADDLIAKINERHSATLDDAKKLRLIAEQSQVTRKLSSSEIATASPIPIVIEIGDFGRDSPRRIIRSSRFDSSSSEAGAGDAPSIHAVNKVLQEASLGAAVTELACRCEKGQRLIVTQRSGCIEWDECRRCGLRSGSRIIRRSRLGARK